MSVEIIHETLLESPISSPEPEDNLQCPACAEKIKDPIVLSCLHVFCMACLLKQVDETKSDLAAVSIICKKCEHETALPAGGLSELTPEYVLIDIMEMDNLSNDQIICTSCKAKELAVAKCEDCVNLLCKNCVTAHQFMRCFEGHTLIHFDELKDGQKTALHNPILCKRHLSQHLKMYCRTCEVVCCNECMTSVHTAPQHMVVKISDLVETEREAFGKIISEVKGNASECDDLSGNLTSSLGELQSQGDNAKDLINETFQSYKAILEKIKDDMLNELDSLHSNKELALMDTCHNIEKLAEKMEDSIGFGEHVLNNGNGLQLMLMKRIIADRFSNLLGQVPNPEIDVNIEFETNAELFEEMTRKGFGQLKKDDPTVSGRPLSSLQSSLDNEGFQYLLMSRDGNKMPPQQELASVIPQSSMQSHLNHNLPNMTNKSAQSLPINRSHSMVESRSFPHCSYSPAMSDSGISVDAGSTNSNSSAPFFNIAALAKFGVDYNAPGMTGCTDISDLMAATSDNSHISGSKPNWSGACPPGLPSSSNDRTSPWSEIGYQDNQPTPDLEALAGLLSGNPRPGSTDITSQIAVSSTFNPSNSIGTLGSIQDSYMYGAIGGNVGIAGRQASNPGNTTPTLSVSGTLSASSNAISTVSSSQGMVSATPPVRRFDKMSAMQIRCKFGQLGPGKGQFNSPHGFCLGKDDEILIADTNNHRIQVFEKSGEFLYQFGIPGRDEGQLWYPRKVAVMKKSGRVIVCDRGNERSRMQIFTKSGQFVRKIAIRYIDIVAGLAISAQGKIVAVDSVSPTVFVISENGELIKWFDCSDYMREPSDIAIDGKEYFVCDFKAHSVIVFNEDGHFQRRIGCENITNYPNGIDISDNGDILVGDSHGNRFHVAVFMRDGELIGEFECPYVKVSRCCGLKITSEGYVVTLAKNNHHVLVLNTLYIT